MAETKNNKEQKYEIQVDDNGMPILAYSKLMLKKI